MSINCLRGLIEGFAASIIVPTSRWYHWVLAFLFLGIKTCERGNILSKLFFATIVGFASIILVSSLEVPSWPWYGIMGLFSVFIIVVVSIGVIVAGVNYIEKEVIKIINSVLAQRALAASIADALGIDWLRKLERGGFALEERLHNAFGMNDNKSLFEMYLESYKQKIQKGQLTGEELRPYLSLMQEVAAIKQQEN